MKKRIAIFDMDGTLMDSTFQWDHTAAVTLFRFGHQLTDEEHRELRRLGFFKSAAYAVEHFSLPCSPQEFLDRGYDIMAEQYRSFILMRPNAKRYIQQLRSKGVKCVIMTASAGFFADIMIEKFGLHGLIDAVYSAHDLHMEKSEPAIYHKLFDELGCTAEECVMFEDSAYALKTAGKLGIDGVGVMDPVHADRYGMLKQAAVRCVTCYDELLEHDVF